MKTVINAIMNAVLLIRMVSRLLLSDIVRFYRFLPTRHGSTVRRVGGFLPWTFRVCGLE